MTQRLQTIDRFSGTHRFLSNFYPVKVVYQGVPYPSTEHAFNAAKTEDLDDRMRIAATGSPAAAKQIGRSVTLRPDWDSRVRYEAMREVLQLKFAWPALAALLANTGQAELIEGNTWHDTHWGVCYCARHRGAGDNHLGRMLMQLREQLS